jgi:endonuclease I
MTVPAARFARASALAVCLASPAYAQYYAAVDDSDSATLRATLHEVIDDHTRFPYTAGGTDTWDILELAQRDPQNANRVIDVYKNESWALFSGYEREHTWPKSFGFPDDGPDNYPYTDCHMLHLCDPSYNAARSNKPFRFCNPGCAEYPTAGGGAGTYPGNSNWTSGSFASGTWQVWSGKQGDVARALLYADVRYEGGTHNVTGAAEPDLILTDSQSLISNSSTGNNEPVAYMGLISVLLQWHASDPVDQFELDRNDRVFQFQGNRNPFVDHPEWVDCLFAGTGCGGGFGDVYCTPGVPNSTGNSASISASGSLVAAANDIRLVAQAMPQNQFGYFITSETQGFVSGPGGSQGSLCLGGALGRFTQQVQSTGIFGTFEIAVDLGAMPVTPPQAVQAGETWHFQAWYRDANPGPTSNFTDAISLAFQ